MISSLTIIAACSLIGMSFIFGIGKGFVFTLATIATCASLWLVATIILA